MFVDINEAADLLAHSQPIAIPTETVWGLAACVHDQKAIEEVFRLKKRPASNPLIVHVSDYNQVEAYTGTLPDEIRTLANHFWPGSLTIVVPVLPNTIHPRVCANLPTCAFRMPANQDTRTLIDRVGPIVAPSANRSGRPSATKAEHILTDFGDSLPILRSSSSCEKGMESTIIILKNNMWHLGRYGALSTDILEQYIGYPLAPICFEKPLCPGAAFRHYAPNALLTLSKQGWKQENAATFDGVLGFCDRSYAGARRIIYLGNSQKPRDVASNLYAALRELDAYALHTVFVDIDIQNPTVMWETIFDRLSKASQGRAYR